MTPELARYLESIKYRSRLDGPDGETVINELEAHLEDSLQQLTSSGLSEPEATETCLRQMGDTRLVARRIYEAYSQGSWPHALLASLPHLLFGLLFLLNWWRYFGWLSVVLVLTALATACGWWRGKPAWVFPWLGYTLAPVIVLGIIMLYLPGVWSLLVLLIYLPLAMWWFFRIFAGASKKDWLLGSLMLLPLPIIIGWYMAISSGGRFTADSLQRVNIYAPWIGLSFISLALTVAAFIRLRRRSLRIGLLAVSGLLMVTLVVYYTTGQLGVVPVIGLALVVWGVLLVPLVLERFFRRGIIAAI